MRSYLVVLLMVGCASQPPAETSFIDALPLRPLSECDGLRVEDVAPADVVLVIDTSFSTGAASGFDIDRDGQVGKQRKAGAAGALESSSTDPADSRLSAEVSGARSLVHHLGDRDVWFSIVAFSEESPAGDATTERAGLSLRTHDVVEETRLTRNRFAVDAAFDRVLEAGSAGGSKFSAGMLLAIRVLSDEADPERGARKLALFISDSARPLITHPVVAVVDPAMQDAAIQAIRSSVRFHTFGIGEALETPPPHALSQIAGATGGRYVAVEDATLLHCHLLRALATAR